MAATGAASPPAPAVVGSPLQIVLFGMPAAGKTSLLGALAQAAQSQEHLLHGRLSDQSQGLAELQHRLYEDNPRRTTEEIVPYAVRFEPFAEPAEETEEAFDAVLIDCDGQVANDLIARRKELSESSPEGTLAREVLDADALILVVDAAAPLPQVEADFTEFGRFLHAFERQRGSQIEVAGLPVFLVLTKCDLLAKSGDTTSDWMEHIEERKRQVHERFQSFLARHAADSPAFGSIDLHLWATAVKRPALAGVAAKPQEPYGVAELFWQCLTQAEHFRRRSKRAGKKLMWTVAGMMGAITVLAAMIIALVVSQQRDRGDHVLENRIERTRDLSAQNRLPPTLAEAKQKTAEWAELRNQSGFASLPRETKELYEQRLNELKDYTAYFEKLQNQQTLPPGGDRADLQTLEDRLRGELAVPRPEWTETGAAKLHASRLAQVQGLLRAVSHVEDWYSTLVRAAKPLLFADRRPSNGGPSVNWADWQAKVAQLLDKAVNPPPRDEEPVPGAEPYTYATVTHLPAVIKAREEWERSRGRLERLRDLSAALGLGGPVPDRPPVLVIPRAPSFTLSQTPDKLRELEKAYPRFEQQFTLDGIPDAAVGEIKQAAKANYDLLLEPGREEVLRQLQRAGGEGESPARWQAIAKWLDDPTELASWRVLARVLVRLHEPKRAEPDPVKDLAGFLKQESFEIDLRRLMLEIPDQLGKRPTDDYVIYLRPAGSDGKSVAFEISERQHDAQRGVTRYQLRPVKSQSLTYHPGDALWATLALRDTENSDQEWALTWTRGRSLVYQFERLIRSPRLHRKGQDSLEGKLVEDVLLTVMDVPLPTVPDLVPVVRFD
jgi:GTPase SAR1 family protein